MKLTKNQKYILAGAVVLGAILLIRKNRKSSEESNFSNAGGVSSYTTSGGRKVCYSTNGRGSIQTIPCP